MSCENNSAETAMDYFSRLPEGLNRLVRDYLTADDILALSTTCRLQRSYTRANFRQHNYTAVIYIGSGNGDHDDGSGSHHGSSHDSSHGDYLNSCLLNR